MKAVIEIDLDNAAFDGLGGPEVELSRILGELAERMHGAEHIKLRDINGNTVGSLEITE